jgi:hypothetical protein
VRVTRNDRAHERERRAQGGRACRIGTELLLSSGNENRKVGFWIKFLFVFVCLVKNKFQLLES